MHVSLAGNRGVCRGKRGTPVSSGDVVVGFVREVRPIRVGAPDNFRLAYVPAVRDFATRGRIVFARELCIPRAESRGSPRALVDPAVIHDRVCAISLPYLKYVAPGIENWTQTITVFRIPSYSIFGHAREHLQLPADRFAFPWNRQLPGRGVVLPRLSDEEVGVFGRSELARKLRSVCDLSRMAGSADLADDWADPDVWAADEAS